MGFSDGPYYAVHKGREPGVYFKWEDCRKQVEGFSNNCYKKFQSIIFAEWFVNVGPKQLKNKLRYINKGWASSGSEVEDCYYDDELSDANDDCESYVCGKPLLKKEKQEEQEEVNDGRVVCRYYLEDNCKFGRNCRFYHPTRSMVSRIRKNQQEELNRDEHDDTERNGGNGGMISSDSGSMNVDNGSVGSSSSIKGVNNKVGRTVCRYWTQGNCRFGSSCRFYHPPPTRTVSNPTSSTNSVVNTARPSSNQTYSLFNSEDGTYYDDGKDYDSDEDGDFYSGYSFGLNNSDLNMLLSYGVKPWDDDADDLLDFLHEM